MHLQLKAVSPFFLVKSSHAINCILDIEASKTEIETEAEEKNRNVMTMVKNY